jgi:hypothetical protein
MKIIGRAAIGAIVGLVVWLAVSRILAAAGAEVHVECTGVGLGFSCALSHDSGSAKADACWDIVVTCQNGTQAQAHACGSVEPRGTTSIFVPIAQMQNADRCDVARTTTVTNMTLQ